MREQIKHLEASIKNYTHFGGSNYDLLKMFEMMQTFFGGQGNVADWAAMPDINSFHPLNNQIEAGDQPKAKQVVETLKTF